MFLLFVLLSLSVLPAVLVFVHVCYVPAVRSLVERREARRWWTWVASTSYPQYNYWTQPGSYCAPQRVAPDARTWEPLHL